MPAPGKIEMSIWNGSHNLESHLGTQPPSGRIEEEIVLVFPSNTMVLNVEDLLEELDLPFELIPVPKEVNPNCGLAISFTDQARPEIMRAINKAGYRPSAAYARLGDHFSPWGDRPYPAAGNDYS